MPRALPSMKGFDPDGADYDYDTAIRAGLGPDETGHWPSREPRTGMILKGRGHPTFSLTEEGEEREGFKIFKSLDGRYYSRRLKPAKMKQFDKKKLTKPRVDNATPTKT